MLEGVAEARFALVQVVGGDVEQARLLRGGLFDGLLGGAHLGEHARTARRGARTLAGDEHPGHDRRE